jgi:hypothetical protein
VATVVLSPHNVVNAADLGGHFWVYMQYAQALLRLGCDVYWLERFHPTGDGERDAAHLSSFVRRLERYGLGGRVILCYQNPDNPAHPAKGGNGQHPRAGVLRYLGMSEPEARQIFRSADLLLNFNHSIEPDLIALFKRTALVDIDPGLLQFWMSTGQLRIARHDIYFTTGETVGTPGALFPGCGLPWIHIPPPVCIEEWPYTYDPAASAFTTVSSWWGDEWITDRNGICYENNKRVSFLDFLVLPRMTDAMLELALYLGDHPAPVTIRPAPGGFQPSHPFMSDAEHRRMLEGHGWRIRHAIDAAGSPELYRGYIQGSRGEFSCAKPSCMKFQNAWVSDRTLCYLASGKPAVVQHTGPSALLPNGEGLFRFSTLEEAAHALASINACYQRHCRAARDIAESLFDGKRIAERLLNHAFSRTANGADGTMAGHRAPAWAPPAGESAGRIEGV